jgi:glutamate--cysteine ligase
MRIGVELEMFVRQPLAQLPECGSVEPGGQLELSPPALGSVDAVVRDMRQRLATLPTEFELAGVDPWRSLDEVPLVLETPRYLALQALFDEHGDAGRQMMRLTASLQVCVDLLPGAAGREQWLVANLAGPYLVDAFCPSRARTEIWRAMDPVRTAYDGRHLDARDPVSAYAAFAATAPRLPIPEAMDDAYHLNTIFPPVRPRGGYLELRYLDSQPVTTEVLGTIWTLLYDDVVRRSALELLLPQLDDYASLWDTADSDELLELVRPKVVAAA